MPAGPVANSPMTSGTGLSEIEMDSRRCSKWTGNHSVMANATAKRIHGTCATCDDALCEADSVKAAAATDTTTASATTGPTAGAVGPVVRAVESVAVLTSAAGPA